MGDGAGGSTGSSWRGRRDARWMAMWPASVLVGAAYGFALVWVAVLYVGVHPDGAGLTLSVGRYAVRSVAFGLFYGACGLACGLPVALALTFLVGDATGVRARRAARLVGGVTHAVGGFVLLALNGGGVALLLWWVVASVLVGLVAGRWFDRLAARPRVEDFYAH